MSLGEAIELAKSAGYATAIPKGTWRGMAVYAPIGSVDEPGCTGYPDVILETESGVRFSTIDEALEYMGLPVGEL